MVVGIWPTSTIHLTKDVRHPTVKAAQHGEKAGNATSCQGAKIEKDRLHPGIVILRTRSRRPASIAPNRTDAAPIA
jgi:hypothetical protein